MPKENTIKLNDGTILDESHCSHYDSSLWCYVSGKTMAECMQIFSNPEKTAEIESYFYAKTYRYIGFTELLLIQKSEDGVNVRLTWPEDGHHSVEVIDNPHE